MNSSNSLCVLSIYCNIVFVYILIYIDILNNFILAVNTIYRKIEGWPVLVCFYSLKQHQQWRTWNTVAETESVVRVYGAARTETHHRISRYLRFLNTQMCFICIHNQQLKDWSILGISLIVPRAKGCLWCWCVKLMEQNQRSSCNVSTPAWIHTECASYFYFCLSDSRTQWPVFKWVIAALVVHFSMPMTDKYKISSTFLHWLCSGDLSRVRERCQRGVDSAAFVWILSWLLSSGTFSEPFFKAELNSCLFAPQCRFCQNISAV